MINFNNSRVSFGAWYDRPTTTTGKEALKKAKNEETNGILKNCLHADNYGNIYYELDNGKKCYSREEAVREIGKNLVDYVR